MDPVSRPVGSAGATGASTTRADAGLADETVVWVLDDARAGGSDACVAIAERLGMEFRRVPLLWSRWDGRALIARGGSAAGLRIALPLADGAPGLTLSTGLRGASVAAFLKRRHGSRMVHYGPAGLHGNAADLHARDADQGSARHTIGVLGPPQRVTPLMLHSQAVAWHERLAHLPRPRLALLLGGGTFGAELSPAAAFALARGLAAALGKIKGAILAVTDRHTGSDATEAASAGLAGCVHVLFRHGEPGPNPELGVIASCDTVVLAGHAPGRLLQACASRLPIYVTSGPGLGRPTPALHRRLIAAGQVRRLEGEIASWHRPALDEAGRIAAAVRGLSG